MALAETQNLQPNTLLNLPPEIRNSLYTLVFSSLTFKIRNDECAQLRCICPDSGFGLMRTCKRINEETSGFRHRNVKVITTQNYLPEAAGSRELIHDMPLLPRIHGMAEVLVVEEELSDIKTMHRKTFSLFRRVRELYVSHGMWVAYSADGQNSEDDEKVGETLRKKTKWSLERYRGLQGRVHSVKCLGVSTAMTWKALECKEPSRVLQEASLRVDLQPSKRAK